MERLRRALLVAGLLAVGVALFSPIATRAHDGLTAHMVQHVILMVVAAPLLVAGLPERVPGPRSWVAWAIGALIVQSAVMWLWHAPALYEAALDFEPLHGLQHVSYLVTAAVFWWAVGLGRSTAHGGAVPIVFVAALPGSGLGAALTLASRPWYPSYASLDDQQMAGIVMWGFAGLAYVLAAAVIFGGWLAATDRRTPPRPAGVPV